MTNVRGSQVFQVPPYGVKEALLYHPSVGALLLHRAYELGVLGWGFLRLPLRQHCLDLGLGLRTDTPAQSPGVTAPCTAKEQIS